MKFACLLLPLVAMPMIEASYSMFSGEVEVVYKNSFIDEKCVELVKSGLCEKNAKEMDMICKKSCMDKIPYYKSTKVDDDEAFFDLIAKRFDVGAPDIIFDNFDGFITAIVNIPLTCSEVEIERQVSDFDRLLKVVPRNVQFVVFPFKIGDGSVERCKSFSNAISQGRRNVYVAEPTWINGPDTHPVYKYLKETSELSKMKEEISTFFFVNPMGTHIDALEGLNYEKVTRYGNERLKGKWEL